MTKSQISEEDKVLIEQWLKKNKLTTCPPMTRSDPDTINQKYGWGSKKKKKK